MAEKASVGLLTGLLAYVIGQINMVTVVLFMFIVIDFGTGVLGSWYSGEKYNEEKASRGVIKKAGYIILWFMGVLLELVVRSQGEVIGITLNVPFISLAISFWLLGTEGLSILANLHKMGVKGIPEWFTKYFERMTHELKVSKDEKGA